MRRVRRVIRWVVYGTMLVLGLMVGVYYAVAHTAPGVERAGRYALDRVRGALQGELRVARISSRSLLGGITLHGVELDTGDRRRFATADSVHLGYALLQLIRGRIVFDDVRIHGADVLIERLPGDAHWSYDRLVRPGDGGAGGERPAVALDGVTIDGASVTVRMPWRGTDEEAQQRRAVVEPVPGGLVRVLRFEVERAVLARVVIQTPTSTARQIIVRELVADAHVLDAPIRVRDLDGTVEIQDSVVSFTARRLELPASRTTARGRVVTGDELRYDLQFVGADAAFADLRWLFPQLPADGRAAADLTLRTLAGDALVVDARNADVRSGASHVRGSFGMVTGSTRRFQGVDLEVMPLELSLIERIGDVELPLAGLIRGTLVADGPLHELRMDGDMRLSRRDGSGERANLRWVGVARVGEGFMARELETEIRRLELGLIAEHAPALALRGVVRGALALDGTLADGLSVRGGLSHVAGGRESRIGVDGTVAAGDTITRVDVRFDAENVALETVAVQFPQVEPLAGDVSGTITARGPLNRLDIDAELDTPAGAVALQGHLDRTGDPVRYGARGELRSFALDAVVRGLPETRLTTRFAVDGQGLEAASLTGRFGLDLEHARVREFDIRGATVRLSLGGGRAFVDTLTVQTDLGRLAARGEFGLDAAEPGTAEIELIADSLAALRSVFFPDTALIVDPSVSSIDLGGSLTLRSRLRGSIERFDAEGTVMLRSGRYEAAEVDTADVTFRAFALRTDSAALEADVDARSLRFEGRSIRRAALSGRYVRDGTGRLRLQAEGDGEAMAAVAAFRLEHGNTSFDLDSLEFTIGRQSWRLAQATAGRVGADGLRLDEFVVNRSSGGRLSLTGSLPWRERLGDATAGPGQADFTAEADGFRIGEALRLAQADTTLDGIVAGRLRVTGTARSPRIEGRVHVDSARLGNARLDSLSVDVAYRDLQLEGRFDGWRDDDRILDGTGTVPVDLALGGLDQRRLERPLSVHIRSAEVPAALALAPVKGFRDVEGRVNGTIELGGTTLEPVVGGSLRMEQGAATFGPLGVRYRSIQASFDLVEPGVVSVAGRVETELGGADLDGRIIFRPVSDPEFALTVTARRLQAARRNDFRALASGDVRLTGRYTRPVVTGNLQLSQGELNIGELYRQSQIVQLESPLLFEVIDTSLISVRQVLPSTTSPFLQNVRVDDLALAMGSNFWLRSRQLDVVLSGELTVDFDRQQQDIAMTGVLQAVRGTYVLQPGAERFGAVTESFLRRFDIQTGTIEFVGTPGIDPNLDVTAAYRVNLAGRGAESLTITATVVGTLLNPRVALSSDAQPAISETDLLSYLYFGQPSYQLDPTRAGIVSGLLLTTLSTGLQNVFSSAGIFDYFGISAPTLADPALPGDQPLYAGTLVEFGRYLGSDFFLAGSLRAPHAGTTSAQQASTLSNILGARIEWRFRPTYTLEAFWESRYLRQPAFGLGLLADQQRPVGGVSLFREWSY